jgi:large subunit ribosomal protein L13
MWRSALSSATRLMRATATPLGRAVPALPAATSLGWAAPALTAATRSIRVHPVYTMQEHQARAMQQAGRLPNKYQFKNGKPRMDKKFIEPDRAWILVDAYGEQMGRLASKIVTLLCGKHKPIYQKHRDTGDYVVIVNAAYIVANQKAFDNKRYHHHSSYPGGLKIKPLWRLFEDNPTEPLRRAIFGMMPKNRLRHQRMTRLRLFPAGEHAQEAQLGSTYGARGFRGALLPGDGPIQLQRIATSVEEE